MAEFSTDPNKPTNPAAPSGNDPVPSENPVNPAITPPLDPPPASTAAPQPPNPTSPPPPTISENQGVGAVEGAISPPQNPAPPEPLTTDPTSDPKPSGLGGPTPLSGTPPQASLGSLTSQATSPENTTAQPTLPTDPTPPLTSEEVGPPWMRTDPNVRASQDAVGESSTPDLTPGASEATETVPPWQQQTEPSVDVSNAEEPNQGHFPVIIFVILVLGIVVAIGVFLFTQGALPFS